MGLASLTVTTQTVCQFNAQGTAVGTGYLAPTVQGNPVGTIVYGTGSANAANNTSSNGINGADEIISFIQAIGTSATVALDLTAIANVLGTTVALARLKYYKFELLNSSQDSTGTACSSVAIGAAATHAVQLNNAGAALTVNNGGSLCYEDNTAAGMCTVVAVTSEQLKLHNNDASVVASLRVTLIGGTT